MLRKTTRSPRSSGRREPTGSQAAGTDTIVTVDGVPHAFGRRADGFGYASATARGDGHRLQTRCHVRPASAESQRDEAHRRRARIADLEVWTTFQAMGNPVTISNIDGFRAVVAPGTVHWVTGEQPLTSGAGPDTRIRPPGGTPAARPVARLLAPRRARPPERCRGWRSTVRPTNFTLRSCGREVGRRGLAHRRRALDGLGWGTMSTVVGGTSVEGPHVLVGPRAWHTARRHRGSTHLLHSRPARRAAPDAAHYLQHVVHIRHGGGRGVHATRNGQRRQPSASSCS